MSGVINCGIDKFKAPSIGILLPESEGSPPLITKFAYAYEGPYMLSHDQ
jgi:hypothetical protein